MGQYSIFYRDKTSESNPIINSSLDLLPNQCDEKEQLTHQLSVLLLSLKSDIATPKIN